MLFKVYKKKREAHLQFAYQEEEQMQEKNEDGMAKEKLSVYSTNNLFRKKDSS